MYIFFIDKSLICKFKLYFGELSKGSLQIHGNYVDISHDFSTFLFVVLATAKIPVYFTT